MVCDWHEDVLVVNSPTDPIEMELYQVKTRKDTEKAFSLSDLIRKRGKSRKHSWLGSLAGNCVRFLSFAIKGILISNVGFDMKLAGGGKTTSRADVAFAELDDSTRERITKAIGRELGVSEPEQVAAQIRFQKTSLSAESHSQQSRGHVVDFIEELYPGRKYQAGPIYRVLFAEIKRRTDYEGDCSSSAELCDKKGMSRHDLSDILACAEIDDDESGTWARVERRLD